MAVNSIYVKYKDVCPFSKSQIRYGEMIKMKKIKIEKELKGKIKNSIWKPIHKGFLKYKYVEKK